MKYIIETNTFCDGWVNTWMENDAIPVVFDTREEAQTELDLYLTELSIDFDLGNIDDFNPDDYRITEVTA
jgi:hypothetical protein